LFAPALAGAYIAGAEPSRIDSAKQVAGTSVPGRTAEGL